MRNDLVILLALIGLFLPSAALAEDLFPPSTALADEKTWDVLIINARIVDGSGSPWFRGAVAISGDKIAWVGSGAPDLTRAREIVDAHDKIVSPGFIDFMGQSSLVYLTNPRSALSRLTQGITVHVSGEGDSAAPQNDVTQPKPVLIDGKGHRWRTYAEYFKILESHGLPLNVVHNVGASQVRKVVIGETDRTPTPAEMEAMKRLVDEAMRDGAAGLSTALIYPPGIFQSQEEIVALAKVVRPYGGIYSTHMRNESDKLLDAIDEAIAIGQEAGVPVEIYHLKAAGISNWPLMEKAIARITAARVAGVDVTADMYPYIRNGIGLEHFIPARYYAVGRQEFLSSLADPSLRKTLKTVIETEQGWENWYHHVGNDWNNVQIIDEARGKDIAGLSITEAARRRGKDVWTFVFDAIQAGGVEVAPLTMNEEQQHLKLASPFIMFNTDTPPASPEVDGRGTHPRTYGTMPRVLAKYVREEKILTLEDAVRRMTSAAANRIGLFDRGRIGAGYAADIVLFDADTIQDHADFRDPARYSTGVERVWVNGVLVLKDGAMTRKLPGKALRPNASKRVEK